MIPEQTVKITVNHRRILTYYEKRGYTLNGNGVPTTIKIHSKDLPNGSSIKVKYNCDLCGKQRETFYFTLSKKTKHLCRSCSRKGKEPSNKVYLTSSEIEFIEKCYSEEWISPRAIGKYLNYSEPVIYRALKEIGYPINRRGKKPNLVCPICNKRFTKSQSDIKEVNCCSRNCRCVYQRKRIDLSCSNCGETFQVRPHQNNRKFCSFECATEYSKKGMATGCKICGKKIWSTPSVPRIFCSMECFSEAKKTGEIIDCAFCGSPKYVPKCHFRNELYFCSHKCSIKYRQIDYDYYSRILEKSRNAHLKRWREDLEWANQRRKEASLTAIKTLKKYKKGISKIELKVHHLLKKLDIDFIPQKEVSSSNYSVRKVYDLYLPNSDLYIEIHGGFWHADPRFYPSAERLTPVQRKNLINDKIKNDIVVNELNKKLFILWEHDILTNIQEVKSKLINWGKSRQST